DPIRGDGTFERILAGIRNLANAGLVPVITVTEACADAGTSAGRTRFLEFLRGIGLSQPRLKVLPLLRLGAETARSRGYAAWETPAGRAPTPAEAGALPGPSRRPGTAQGRD